MLKGESALYRILVVEDDDHAAQRLETLLERYAEEHKLRFSIQREKSAFDLAEAAQEAGLVFLDIELPGTDGMKAARGFRDSGLDVPIVFVTNLAQRAVEGYAVSALDFIVKPVDYAALTLRMDRAMKAMDARSEHTICIQAKQGLHAVQAKDLIIVETRGHDIVYCLKDGSELLARKALREAASELPSPPFLQISSGCIINMAYATGMEGSKIELSDCRAVYMSRGHRKSCLQALARYLGGCL
jgi:DNA-binding LytR/AlgR family response regulator